MKANYDIYRHSTWRTLSDLFSRNARPYGYLFLASIIKSNWKEIPFKIAIKNDICYNNFYNYKCDIWRALGKSFLNILYLFFYLTCFVTTVLLIYPFSRYYKKKCNDYFIFKITRSIKFRVFQFSLINWFLMYNRILELEEIRSKNNKT